MEIDFASILITILLLFIAFIFLLSYALILVSHSNCESKKELDELNPHKKR